MRMYLLDVFLNTSGDAAANPAILFLIFFKCQSKKPIAAQTQRSTQGPLPDLRHRCTGCLHIVYQIKCKECAGPYVGEAEHLMETRLEEHNGEARRQARTRPGVITTAPSIPMPPSYSDKVHFQLLQWSPGRQIGRVENCERQSRSGTHSHRLTRELDGTFYHNVAGLKEG